MCEVTWNTWGSCECERSWCQCMSFHALKILRFRSLSLVVSLCRCPLTVFLDSCTQTEAQVCALFTPSSSPCFMRVLSDVFDFSSLFISYLFISLLFLLFLLPCTFYFLDVVDHNHAHFRWGAGSPGQKELFHRCDVGEKFRRLLEFDWDRDLSDTWIGFTRPHFTEWKATRSIFTVREETDEETNDLKTRDCVARYVEAYVTKRPFAWDIGHSRAHQGPLSMTWWGIDRLFLLLLFSNPCHTLHPRHLCMSHCTCSYISSFFNKIYDYFRVTGARDTVLD